MPQTIQIGYLAHHRRLIPEMTAAFIKAWPGHCGPGGGDAPTDLHACCHETRLPIGLVAVDAGRFCGAAILRSRTQSHAHLGPWFGSA
jgi:hypothetical protein